MPRSARSRGPQVRPEIRRYNRDGMGPPGSMNRDSGPAHIPPNDFRLLVNVRWEDDAIVARGGARQLNASPLHSSTACLFVRDFDFGTPLKAYWCGDGCPGESIGTGFYLANFDPNQEPQFQRGAWYQGATTSFHIGKFSGELHIGVDDSVRRVAIHPVPYGTEALSAAGENDQELFTLPSGYHVTFLKEFDGKLFIGAWNGAAGQILSWDGVTKQTELTGLSASPNAACLWRDNIVVAIDGVELRVRDVGPAPGTGLWTTVSGTVASYGGLNSMVSFRDVVYIAGGGTTIYSYNGSTIAAARVIAGATIESVCVAFDKLFYGYLSTTPAAVVGNFDGSTWTDVHKTFTEVINLSNVRMLQLYRDSLVAGVTGSGGTTSRILGSRGSATAGTYDVHVGPLSFATSLDYGVVL